MLTFWVLVVVVKRLQLLCVVHDRELICVKGVEECRCSVEGVSKCVSMDTGVDGVERCQTGVEALDTNSTRLDVCAVSKCPKCRVSKCRWCQSV